MSRSLSFSSYIASVIVEEIELFGCSLCVISGDVKDDYL